MNIYQEPSKIKLITPFVFVKLKYSRTILDGLIHVGIEVFKVKALLTSILLKIQDYVLLFMISL